MTDGKYCSAVNGRRESMYHEGVGAYVLHEVGCRVAHHDDWVERCSCDGGDTKAEVLV